MTIPCPEKDKNTRSRGGSRGEAAPTLIPKETSHYAVGNVLYTVGNVLYAVGTILYAVGNVLYAVGSILYTVGNIFQRQTSDAHRHPPARRRRTGATPVHPS